MRLQHRKDTLHDAYVSWLEARGWLCFDTHNISGFVDLIAVQRGSSQRGRSAARVIFCEFKSTAKDYGKDKARAEKQSLLHQKLRAEGAEVWVIRCLEDLVHLEPSAA